MGLRIQERYVLGGGLLFMALVCYSTLYFLPSDEQLFRVAHVHSDDHVHHEEEDGMVLQKPHVHVRDLEERRREQLYRDQKLLKAKADQIELPPPIPMPEIGGSDDADARRITVKQEPSL